MTSVDMNVVTGLLNEDDAFNLPAKRSLQKALSRGSLIICAPVFVELCAMPKRDDFDLDIFLQRVRIEVDWVLEEEIWRESRGRQTPGMWRNAADSAQISKTSRDPIAQPAKRVAADFLIGAHALVRGAELLTFDKGVFKTYFPTVKIVEP